MALGSMCGLFATVLVATRLQLSESGGGAKRQLMSMCRQSQAAAAVPQDLLQTPVPSASSHPQVSCDTHVVPVWARPKPVSLPLPAHRVWVPHLGCGGHLLCPQEAGRVLRLCLRTLHTWCPSGKHCRGACAVLRAAPRAARWVTNHMPRVTSFESFTGLFLCYFPCCPT